MIAAAATLVALQAAIEIRMGVVAALLAQLGTKAPEPAVDVPDLLARPPAVVGGWLPPKVAGVEDFPFFLVRPRSGSDSQQGAAEVATATFDVIVGTYSDTDDGWVDTLLVIEAIRQSLGGQPVLAGTAFEHVGPLAWEMAEEQPRPYWLGRVQTQWVLPRPARIEALNPTED